MHIAPKITLRYGSDATQDDAGDPQPGWYFEYRGMSIFNPYFSIGFTEPVDPTAEYGITREQAIQLCILNKLGYPQ